MRLLDRLLDRAIRVIPADLLPRMIVYGSAPMVLAGLKSDVTFDLDLFTDERTFQELKTRGVQEDQDDRGLPRILVVEAVESVEVELDEEERPVIRLAEVVEVVAVWPGVEFDEVFAAAVPLEGSRGLRVASLEHVLAFKVLSTREKDIREAAVIREARKEQAD